MFKKFLLCLFVLPFFIWSIEQQNEGIFFEIYHPDVSLERPVGYVMGTVHLVSPKHADMLKLNDKINAAFERSKYFLPELDSIKDRKEILAENGLEETPLTLNDSVLFEDDLLTRAYAKEKHEVIPMEKISDQLEMLIAFKKEDASSTATIHPEIIELFNYAWKLGYLEFFEEVSKYNLLPELMIKRNLVMANMIDRVAKRASCENETFFAFPGTGHLVGEKNVLQILEKEGYIIKRILK